MRPAEGENASSAAKRERQFISFSFFAMAKPSPTAPRPAIEDATSPAPAANQPVAVFRFEHVSASVFANDVKLPQGSVTLLSTSLRRSFKNADGAWQHTHSLRASDLLPAALALLKCYEFVTEAQAKDSTGE